MRPVEFRKLIIVHVIFSLLAGLATAAAAAEPGADTNDLFSRYVIKESSDPVRNRPAWRRPERVAILVPSFVRRLRPDYEDWFQQAAGDAELRFASSREELRAAAVGADVVLGTCRALNADMPELRWVQRYGVGVERCLSQPALSGNDVLLTNTRGLSGPYIAEHVIAMTMMLSHSMHKYYRKQLDADWDRSREFTASVQPVSGKNMLVVGLGGIGTKVAEKAAALSMRVTAIRNSSRSGPEFVDYVGLSGELLELAAKADFVVNTAPLTAKTRGLYDKVFFSTMKDSAYFINIGRGKSVVTDDLVAALSTGEIAGAGLDVTDPEPLPASHPLWKMPSVLITPHTAGRSGDGSVDTLLFVRENLRRYTAGEPMLNVVDRTLEY